MICEIGDNFENAKAKKKFIDKNFRHVNFGRWNFCVINGCKVY